MLSSLSRVPPVWPRPRPEIIGRYAPQAASNGASNRLTQSPTPPVECLSSTGPGRYSQRSRVPESHKARVSVRVSSASMSRQATAIANAAICASLHAPLAIPVAISCNWPASRRWPSRFWRINAAAFVAVTMLEKLRRLFRQTDCSRRFENALQSSRMLRTFVSPGPGKPRPVRASGYHQQP